MTLFGLLWAAFAPVLIVVAVALTALALRRFGRRRAWGAAAALVLLPIIFVHWTDRRAFAALCAELGEPVIHAKASADGILLSSPTANSFGYRYVQSEGFDWMEIADIYRKAPYVRVSRVADGKLAETPTEAPPARYEVPETYEARPSAGGSTTIVRDRETGAELARGADATFDGGRARWLLGAWGVSSCRTAAADPASFNAWYHLARNTLR